LPTARRRAIVHGTIGRIYGTPLFCTIVRLPAFERSASGILGAAEEAWLDDTLARHPELGTVIRGTGGVRKIRVALPGRGKSGGARVIYYYHGGAERVFLILAYSKKRKEDLTGAERVAMRKLTALLAEES
jgi:mRNA-degrading endonuclease RelE of RelBE toxin-antitoxin system